MDYSKTNGENIKMKIKKSILIVIILLLKAITITSQNKLDEKLLINNFVKSVFFENADAKSIAGQYIYFEPISNVKYSLADRIKILNKHLKKIKKENSLLNPADFYIVRYEDYKNDKIIFSKKTNSIFILVSKSNPVMYFSLLKEKIFAFDYIIKGGEVLFITY
ncbi:hypothetical protein [Flavobacterium soyae]|uniref:DUF4252 domain-containing protein n=1 Tax=Flavobacterium soyae TaxID=2903098 RepID=A0ABZ2UMD0_9FLAO